MFGRVERKETPNLTYRVHIMNGGGLYEDKHFSNMTEHQMKEAMANMKADELKKLCINLGQCIAKIRSTLHMAKLEASLTEKK